MDAAGSGRTTFIFAGGGTGGHLYPGLAIARALEELAARRPVRSVFLCSERSIDRGILEGEGVSFEPVPARPASVRPRGLVRFVRSWGPSVRRARAVIRAARDEGTVRVVAMGGFVAAPVVQAARAERVPVTLVNLDAVPGKANRWIARRASEVVTALPVEGVLARDWALVPPIVRREAVAPADPARCRRELGLDPARPVLMVTGGSQGARTLNNLLVELVRRDPGALRGWQVVHQCGRGEDEPVEGAYRLANVPALVCEFVREMATWWGAAELAVSRCGAGSVGEAWANQVPALFLPYPYHRDEHQRHNAAALVRAGGAVLARDHADTETNAREILPVLAALLRGAPRRAEMRAALRRLGPADGATRVARQLLDAAGTSTRPRSGLLSGP